MEKITVKTTVNLPVQKVWDYWTQPEHIVCWNNASDDWHTPRAENDLRTGGNFSSRMEARDGSMGFDFEGVYDQVEPHSLIAYTMADGRSVHIRFSEENGFTLVEEVFDPEATNPAEMQRMGWQAILDNFKRYAEAQ